MKTQIFAVVYLQHGTHVKRVKMCSSLVCKINVFSLSKRGTLDQKIGTGLIQKGNVWNEK